MFMKPHLFLVVLNLYNLILKVKRINSCGSSVVPVNQAVDLIFAA